MDQATRDDAPAATTKDKAEMGQAAQALAAGHGDTVIARSVTINRPAQEVYAFFRDFSNLPRFMENIERIDVADERRSHWVVKAPAGGTVEWDAVVTEDQPGRLLAWQTEEGSEVPNGGRGGCPDAGAGRTGVPATISHDPPGGPRWKGSAQLCPWRPVVQAAPPLLRCATVLDT